MLDEKRTASASEHVARLLDAILHHRRATMRYDSFSSNREKEYLIEPCRLVFAQGGLYLVAFVPEYRHLRTFALDRVIALSVTEERFEPLVLEDDAFAHSLGVHQGTAPEAIEIQFDPRIARYVKGRVWHPTQTIRDQPDGGIIVELRVSNDWALKSWILGFGPLARVMAPPELATGILEEIERARSLYIPRLE
jgi:predicted DNA-binding transcriptional regulator YafY